MSRTARAFLTLCAACVVVLLVLCLNARITHDQWVMLIGGGVLLFLVQLREIGPFELDSPAPGEPAVVYEFTLSEGISVPLGAFAPAGPVGILMMLTSIGSSFLMRPSPNPLGTRVMLIVTSGAKSGVCCRSQLGFAPRPRQRSRSDREDQRRGRRTRGLLRHGCGPLRGRDEAGTSPSDPSP